MLKFSFVQFLSSFLSLSTSTTSDISRAHWHDILHIDLTLLLFLADREIVYRLLWHGSAPKSKISDNNWVGCSFSLQHINQSCYQSADYLCCCWYLWSSSPGTSVTTAPLVIFIVVPSENISLADVSSDKTEPAWTHRKLYGIRPTTDNQTSVASFNQNCSTFAVWLKPVANYSRRTWPTCAREPKVKGDHNHKFVKLKLRFCE